MASSSRVIGILTHAYDFDKRWRGLISSNFPTELDRQESSGHFLKNRLNALNRILGRHNMRKALLILCSLLWSFSAHAQAPFYQGKTIRVIVGTPPGNL